MVQGPCIYSTDCASRGPRYDGQTSLNPRNPPQMYARNQSRTANQRVPNHRQPHSYADAVREQEILLSAPEPLSRNPRRHQPHLRPFPVSTRITIPGVPADTQVSASSKSNHHHHRGISSSSSRKGGSKGVIAPLLPPRVSPLQKLIRNWLSPAERCHGLSSAGQTLRGPPPWIMKCLLARGPGRAKESSRTSCGSTPKPRERLTMMATARKASSRRLDAGGEGVVSQILDESNPKPRGTQQPTPATLSDSLTSAA